MASFGTLGCARSQLIRKLALSESKTITLGQLMRSTNSDPESLIRQARWLHRQLPIRFARRIDDFIQLPYVVVKNPRFNEVLSIYLDTFDAVVGCQGVESIDQETEFCNLVQDQLERHQKVPRLLSEGYGEVRHMYPGIRLDSFLENLFITRISSRILMENYVGMRVPQEGFVGVVRRDLCPWAFISDLLGPLTSLTRSVYGFSPEVELRGNPACALDYIPQHVRFMTQELLKNALRATAERHGSRLSIDDVYSSGVPPVNVEFQKGDFHVIIKISDQGGGMSKSIQKQAWQYGWTTVPEEETVISTPQWKKEIAGYGFGLPLTRLHAQYFGGDVFMQAMPGHGTDMYLLLNHLKEGDPSTEMDDPSTSQVVDGNVRSTHAP